MPRATIMASLVLGGLAAACQTGVEGTPATGASTSAMGGASHTSSGGANSGGAGTGGFGGGPTPDLCGNGVMSDAEGCDDGNAQAGDGCDSMCNLEAGFVCRGLAPSVCMPHWRVDLVSWVGVAVDLAPGSESEGLLMPTDAELSAFEPALAALLADDWAGAKATAGDSGYRAVVVEDLEGSSDLLLALLPSTWTANQPAGGDGRGLYLARTEAATDRQLVFEAPHPRFDGRSGIVATMAFRALHARALAVAGTHRCANAQATPCSGTTSVCSQAPQAYRESDMAHIVTSFFQRFHQLVHVSTLNTVVQVHGMSGASGLLASISDGTTSNVNDELYVSNRLAGALGIAGAASGSNQPDNSCNRSGDINVLCGTTNTQGRFSNGVDAQAACTMSSGGAAGGRFLHAELGPSLRDLDSPVGPTAFIDAVAATFP